MSSLHHEALMECCHDEAWEEFRIHNKLSEDQLNELCWRQTSGTLVAIERKAQQKFEDLCQ